jgi:hypothetical protein
MLQRMSSLESEWTCRLILGNLGQIQVLEELVMSLLHPGLGAALQIHDGQDGESTMQCQHRSKWRPQLGTAIRHPTYKKA